MLSGFAVSSIANGDMGQKFTLGLYSTERGTLAKLWKNQGDRYLALGGLIARLKELSARAGQKWKPKSPRPCRGTVTVGGGGGPGEPGDAADRRQR